MFSYAQTPHYGDLELTLPGTEGVPVRAIDPDLSDTTLAYTVNSIAFFEDLYIYTEVGIEEDVKEHTFFNGLVRIFDIQGALVELRKAERDGSLLFGNIGDSHPYGLYIATDDFGTAQKFIYRGQHCLLGKPFSAAQQTEQKTAISESNLYEIQADGRVLEWDPFDLTIEEHLLEADIINYVMMDYNITPDGPATGQVEILVNGEPAGDGSQVKIVRTGDTDTLYLQTVNGIAPFDAADGVTSHPFGNFTRDYTILINAFNANSNWFHAESHEVDMALGPGNDFVFTPAPITDAERTANVTLEILIDGTTPAAQDAEVKVYRIGETDTTFAYTNDQGIAQLDRLVHPFQADNHQFAINSDGCASNFFIPLTEAHNLFVGQNDIEMNPDGVPENFAEGMVRVWYGSGTEPNTEVQIWRLNNTIDTVTYITNTAGQFYYEDLPIEGSSSDYVFKSIKEASGPNPTLTSLDTFNLVPDVNPMINIYLEAISQFIRTTGTLRDAENNAIKVSGQLIEITDANTSALLGSATTDANGFYSIAGIPSGAETNVSVIGGNGYLYKTNAYTFHDVVVGSDTLLENRNMFAYPPDWVIPQTANDPAPATVTIDPDLINQLNFGDEKNAEDFYQNMNRIYLTNFGSPSDSAYFFAIEAAIDSLFYGGQGSNLVLVPNSITITSYHQNNYDPLVGFPGELGWNVTKDNGNNTTPIFSNAQTGHYILGGAINITGGINNLESGIKELVGRLNQMGDTDEPGMMYTGQSSMPNHTERAYYSMLVTNLTGRVVNGYEVFPLTGLSTTGKSMSAQRNTEIFEEAEIIEEIK